MKLIVDSTALFLSIVAVDVPWVVTDLDSIYKHREYDGWVHAAVGASL